MTSPVVYPGSRSSEFVMIGVSVGLAVIGVLFALTDVFPMIERIGYGATTAIAGGAATVFAVGRLIRNPPELVLDSDGITVPRLGTVHWRQVAAVRVGTVGPHEALQVILHEPGQSSTRHREGFMLASGWDAVDGRKALVLSPSRMHPHSPYDIILQMKYQYPGLVVAPPAR
ncbi:hypothetical protein ACFVVM_30580 [Nocardia sp. NPDC058176]|uniref:hypothetical protein n=1 Tax=Nocardia sp. NPDC058176 TaxID=3346368 RepID=UPI0036DEB4B3